MPLQIGDIAPDFTMMVSETKEIKLSSLLGQNVVLYFYPKDNTPGCTLEGIDFSTSKEEFSKLNTVVIGVSKDTIKSHCAFQSRFNLTIDLAYDKDALVAQQYGVLVEKSMFGKKYMGIDRTTFLINKTGHIAYIWPDVSVFGHAKAVLEEIKKQGL